MVFRYRDTRGFTLVEMAIILMILGVLVSVGAGMMGVLTKRLKLNETREAVKNASESIIGFAAVNGRIPTSVNFTSVVTVAVDSWANALYYIPAPALTTDNVCARKTTGLALSVCPDKACLTPRQTVTDVAYAIISGGENFNIQTDNKSGIIKVYDQGIGPVDDYSADMTRAEPYDDVVKWATLYELRVKAGCSGPQMRIINKDLPSGIKDEDYFAEVFAEGGVPFTSGGGKYLWCVEISGQTKKGKKEKDKKKKKQKTWLKTKPKKTPVENDCMGLSENKWAQSDTLTFEGKAEVGTTGVTVYVRDNNDTGGPNDNIVSRSFVITVGK
ncbi:MAG: type II secretion system protein [Thermodesulfobacteriota bacterium]